VKRHIFNLLAAVSLVMCVVTLAGWLQSEIEPLRFEHVGARLGPSGGFEGDWGWNISSHHGALVIYTENESDLDWAVRYPLLVPAFGALPAWLYFRRRVQKSARRGTAIPARATDCDPILRHHC
jgi:hypothetical protein